MVGLALTLALANGPSLVEIRRLGGAELPFARVHGMAPLGKKWAVGGLRGLSVGVPGGKWESASDQHVRQMLAFGGEVWAVFGNGAVDKIDVQERLYYDVFAKAVKRPWSSCLGADGKTLMVGAMGGWFEKSGAGLKEMYPMELARKPVTAVCRYDGKTWLGTQYGLYWSTSIRFDRLGFGAGMPDTWVTCLLPSSGGLLAGLWSGGLVSVKGTKVSVIKTPSARVRSLARIGQSLVLGTAEGAWVRTGETWERLTSQETTFLSVFGDRLYVGLPIGVRVFGLKVRGTQSARSMGGSFTTATMRPWLRPGCSSGS